MSKLLIFGIAIMVGVIVNISVLYAIVLGVRNDVMDLQTQIAGGLATPAEKETELAPASFSQSDVVASSSAENVCIDCRKDIDEIKRILLSITPAPGVSFLTQPVGQSAYAREFFIPFGNGKTKANEWEDIAGMSASIDSRNYSGIKAVSFEISLRIPTANGTVSARLFNKTDGHPVWNSEVVSEGPVAVLKTSSNLVLNSGEKTYQVQMKSSLQYESIADSARMKIVLQ